MESLIFSGGINKKGQQMTLATIIAIVLGLVVLVFLIYGFSTGWSNLWERITGLGGGNVNVDVIKTACVLACQQQNTYGFCSQVRNVVFEDGTKIDNKACKNLVGDVVVEEADNDSVEVKKNLGIVNCPGLC